MIGTKIARPRDGRHKNNSPKGWMGGVESFMVSTKITRQRLEN